MNRKIILNIPRKEIEVIEQDEGETFSFPENFNPHEYKSDDEIKEVIGNYIKMKRIGLSGFKNEEIIIQN